jgi:O-methyltransferase
VGFREKLSLYFRFQLNRRRVDTLSDVLEHLELAAAVLRIPPDVTGDVIECGCYKGGSSISLSLVCERTGRRLLICDSFEGLPEPVAEDQTQHSLHTGHTDEYWAGRFAVTRAEVEANISRYGDISVCDFLQGYFEETLPGLDREVALAFLDVDLIDSLRPCIASLWPHLVHGGRLYLHEATSMTLAAVFFDSAWWRNTVGEDAPGLVGAGTGLPLAAGLGSDLGYAQRDGTPKVSS